VSYTVPSASQGKRFQPPQRLLSNASGTLATIVGDGEEPQSSRRCASVATQRMRHNRGL